MKKTLIFKIFFSMLLCLSLHIFVVYARVVGTYKGLDVTTDQVFIKFRNMLSNQEAYKGKSFDQLDKPLQELLVRGYINHKLFEDEAEKLGIVNTEEFKAKLNDVKTQLLQQELIERHLRKVVTVQMIDDEYLKLVKALTGQKECKVAHILLANEDKALDIYSRIKLGSNFIDFINLSKDNISKKYNGELGYVMKGQLVNEFEAMVFKMSLGEVSSPVKTRFGWHIIKILDIRNVRIPSKKASMNSIKAKISREIIEKYLAGLAVESGVKVLV